MPPGMGETSNITVEQHDGVLHAVMHSPPGNELGLSLVTELRAVIDQFEHGGAKVCVLSSGIPGAFASGLDVTRSEDASIRELADYSDALCDALETLARSRRPSIAVIDGTALGGGLELAMACTLRFASRTSRLGLPEVKLGTIPSGGGTQRLPHLIGRGRALELMLSGREIDVEEGSADRARRPRPRRRRTPRGAFDRRRAGRLLGAGDGSDHAVRRRRP